MLKAMQEFAQPLAFKFLDSRAGYFDKEVWIISLFHLHLWNWNGLFLAVD